jgi:hypothetical protein
MVQRAAPKRGTIEQRRAWTEALREARRVRDAARYRIGDELARRSRLSIAPELGFCVVPPGTIPEAAVVAASVNEIVDSIGHARLVGEYNPKKDAMARGFLPAEARRVGSPYLGFALSESVLAPVAAYLRLVPILFAFDAWYSPPSKPKPRHAQRWHLDGDDTTQVKVWIHCADIGPETGPLTALDARRSEGLAEAISYDSSIEYRIADEKVAARYSGDDLTAFVGPAGTVDFVDTSRCFHFGSRVAPNAPSRRVFYVQYVTPYAFKFRHDHREEAPYRHLASAAASELESLVLGAA